MAEFDRSLALRQSIGLLLVFLTTLGGLFYINDDSVVVGFLSGLLMAVIIIVLWWPNVLGDPDRAGWPFD
jgi:hypothetical protein